MTVELKLTANKQHVKVIFDFYVSWWFLYYIKFRVNLCFKTSEHSVQTVDDLQSNVCKWIEYVSQAFDFIANW